MSSPSVVLLIKQTMHAHARTHTVCVYSHSTCVCLLLHLEQLHHGGEIVEVSEFVIHYAMGRTCHDKTALDTLVAFTIDAEPRTKMLVAFALRRHGNSWKANLSEAYLEYIRFCFQKGYKTNICL